MTCPNVEREKRERKRRHWKETRKETKRTEQKMLRDTKKYC